MSDPGARSTLLLCDFHCIGIGDCPGDGVLCLYLALFI